MINDDKIEAYKKFTYYCQRAYNGIQVYAETVKKRRLELADNFLSVIIDDISNMLNYYQKVAKDLTRVDILTGKIHLLFEGVENQDYYLIRDILDYEILPLLEEFFEEIKQDIYSIIS